MFCLVFLFTVSVTLENTVMTDPNTYIEKVYKHFQKETSLLPYEYQTISNTYRKYGTNILKKHTKIC